MESIGKTYDYLFTELADRRVNGWPLISDPWPILGILFVYLFLIYKVLPALMEHRRPFKLKFVIAAYNIYQVVACIVMIYGVATSGWTTHYTFGCQLVDYSNDPLALRMANFMWWHMLLKMSELIETVFFVLRKKYNQVSVLHVYHHASTFFIAWWACKYFAGGMVTFTVLVNSSVHVVMYTYYFLSSLGPRMQDLLKDYKFLVTVVQIVQLISILGHTSQVFQKDCELSKAGAYLYMFNVLINLLLFFKFYIATYRRPKKD